MQALLFSKVFCRRGNHLSNVNVFLCKLPVDLGSALHFEEIKREKERDNEQMRQDRAATVNQNDHEASNKPWSWFSTVGSGKESAM